MPTVEFTVAPGPVVWPLIGPSGEERRIAITPRLRTGDFVMLTRAAADGVGVALLPDYMCEDEVSRGRLIRVLPQWQRPIGKTHVVYASSRVPSPAVRAFVDALVQHYDHCVAAGHATRAPALEWRPAAPGKRRSRG